MQVLPQVSMPFVRLLYTFWLEQGVSKSLLDDILECDVTRENGSKFGIPSLQLAQLHQAAVESTKDHTLGLKLGLYLTEQDFIVSDLVLVAPTLAQGLAALMDHSRVLSESGYFKMDQIDEQYQVLTFTAYEGIVFTSHQQNMVFSSIISLIGKVFPEAQQQLNFHSDQIMGSNNEYSDLLGCQITTSQQVCLFIPSKILEQANPLFDASAYQHCLNRAKKILVKRNQQLNLYLDVRSALKHCLIERNANQENVAGLLNLSVRNLQRRLKEVGANYQSILDESREELARTLLRDNDIPLYEVAYLVGFTEPSAFYKAFKRWTGKRPGDFRQDAEDNIVSIKLNEALSVDE
jgi:AraC-like DNA-binding protein